MTPERRSDCPHDLKPCRSATMLIEIKHRITSDVLFSTDADSFRECVESAIKFDANLHGADLHGAYLHGADLHGADLRGANLHGADLHGANLRDTDLRDTDLRGANLRGANLHGADLHGANLRYAALPEGYRIARLDFGGWPVTVTPTETSIGCETHPNACWLRWSPADVAYMDDGAANWWTRHGTTVQSVIRDVMQP